MKKLVLLLFFVFIITGCGSKKTMVCSYKSNDDISMDLSYRVKYVGSDVISVKSVEKIKSDDSSVIDNYKSLIDEMYELYKNIDNYKYSVSIKGNTLVSNVNINYEKIDLDEMIMIDPDIEQLIENGKINIDLMKISYENLGLTCKK